MTVLYKRTPWLLAALQCSDCRHLARQVFCPRFFHKTNGKVPYPLNIPLICLTRLTTTEQPKAQFYYSFLSLSGIASSLRFHVIIALCTLEWHKLALWGKNQLAGCPSLPVWPGHDKHMGTNACKRHPKSVCQHFNKRSLLALLDFDSRLNHKLIRLLALLQDSVCCKLEQLYMRISSDFMQYNSVMLCFPDSWTMESCL